MTSRRDVAALFDVFIDGRSHGSVLLGLYYPPTVGAYKDGEISVWAGNGAAFLTGGKTWFEMKFDEPIHAIYRLPNGWCVVAEITILTINDAGQIVMERGHNEVIVSSWWEKDLLVLEDFEGVRLTVTVDADALALGEVVVHRV